MINPTRLPELVQRERFMKRLLAGHSAYIVSGASGWASVPLRQDPTRDVILMWSSEAEAVRWSAVVAEAPTVHSIPLPRLLTEVLPMLAARQALVGPDWSTDPADPVCAANDLLERLWRERADRFIAAIRGNDAVWLLESASGPAVLPSERQHGKDVLPVWASREDATQHIAGTWAVKRPISVSLSVFRERYLPFLERRGWYLIPEPLPGCGPREWTPAEFNVRAFPAITLSNLRAVSA